MSLTDEGVFGGKPQFTSQEQAFWYRQRDVKASVRKMKDKLMKAFDSPTDCQFISETIDEEMGEKLI